MNSHVCKLPAKFQIRILIACIVNLAEKVPTDTELIEAMRREVQELRSGAGLKPLVRD
jgi:hypothetical protein